MRNTWTVRQTDGCKTRYTQTDTGRQILMHIHRQSRIEVSRLHVSLLLFNLSPLYLTFHHFTSHSSVLSVPHLPSPCITSHTFFFSSPHHSLSHLILRYHSLPSITSLTPQSCQEIFLWLPSVSSTATRQIATGHFETPSRRLCNQPGTGHDSRCACSPPGK